MMAYYIDTETDEHGPVEVEPKLDEYYRLIHCDCITIAVREIDGHPYNIVLDDEGLLKPNRISAMGVKSGERLYGSMLIFGECENSCDMRSLTDDEIWQIRRRMVMGVFDDGSEHPTFWYTR